MCAQKNSLDFLKETNDWLEKYPINIGAAFDNMIAKGDNIAQDKVDTICTWLAWKVNLAIERKRQETVKELHEMYDTTVAGKVMKAARSIEKFFKDPLRAIGDFASTVFGPVGVIFQWSATLAKELPRLAKNLANIANSLPPNPPTPNLNYDKFRLKINSISWDMIEQSPDNLPSPESLFPEPERPWSPSSFQKEFEEAPMADKIYFYDVQSDLEKDEYSIKSNIDKYIQGNSI